MVYLVSDYLKIDYFHPDVMAMRKLLDDLLLEFSWSSFSLHQRAKLELETIAMNYIEYQRTDEKLVRRLSKFFQQVRSEVQISSFGEYIERTFHIIVSCRLGIMLSI